MCFSHLDFGHQAVFPYLTANLLKSVNVYHRRVIRNILGLHERSGSGTVVTNDRTHIKKIIFPSSNILIYLDFLFSPFEYRWLVNTLKFYNQYIKLSQDNHTMKTLLLACIEAKTGWVHQLSKTVKRYKVGVAIDGVSPVNMQTVRADLRVYWWKWITHEIVSRPHLSFLLSSLPSAQSKLPWENRTTSPPTYLHHAYFLRFPDAVRACISVRSGFLLPKCKCGLSNPPLLHLLWSCPTMLIIRQPLSAAHTNTILDENNVVDIIMNTLVNGGPAFLCTFYFVYKASFHHADL